MRIALDAMGGDHAPREIVSGAIAAAPLLHGEIILVGRTDAIKEVHTGDMPHNIHVREAPDVIEMCEEPAVAVRRKRNSSLVVAAEMVKQGEADAFVSAGNTGAVTAAAHLLWKCVPNISRPAIATVIPCRTGKFVLLDSGATPDADPENLLEFAIMGRVYSETVLGVKNPRIGLLNIGEEESKGNALTKATHKLLKERLHDFGGNVEGKNLFQGEFDVVVCDAFVGNVLLKSAQGLGAFLMEMIKEAMPKNPVLRLPLVFLKGGITRMRKRMDYSEYGGAPLLGVNGICFICHGHSSAKAIKNALLLAQTGHEGHLIEIIATQSAEVKHVGEAVVVQ
jgi:glycerol-3-phosphate acyltransferase PlsX